MLAVDLATEVGGGSGGNLVAVFVFNAVAAAFVVVLFLFRLIVDLVVMVARDMEERRCLVVTFFGGGCSKDKAGDKEEAGDVDARVLLATVADTVVVVSVGLGVATCVVASRIGVVVINGEVGEGINMVRCPFVETC